MADPDMQDLKRRMDGAIREIAHYSDADYLIVNADFAVAVDELCGVVRAERVRLARQRHVHGALIEALLE